MSTISPNMNLPISTVGVDSGLNWENNLNSSLTLIDLHDHTPGKGIQLTPTSFNINADLPFNNNNLTLVRSVRFQSQSAALALVTDIGCIYESGVDLYYNDGSGNQIRITQGGSIAGAAGTITGLPSGTASAAYAAGVFTFQASTNTGANIDGASYVLRNNTANSKGLTLSPPNAMAADYSLVLPSVPGVTSFLTIDSSGNFLSSPALLGALTTSNLSASAGILGSQLSASANIQGSQLSATLALTGSLTVATTLGVTGTTTAAQINAVGVAATGTVSGQQVTAAGAGVVVTNSAVVGNIAVVAASFDSAGNGLTGQGAVCSHNGTGDYTITFSAGFGQTPVVVVTPSSNTGTPPYIVTVSSTAVRIGTGSDTGFNIVALGLR